MDERLLRRVYLALFAVGAAGPWAVLLRWIELRGGLDARAFAEAAFDGRVAAFLSVNLLLSGAVVLTAAWSSLPRPQTVLVTVFTAAAGPSAGLPLLLFFRTRG